MARSARVFTALSALLVLSSCSAPDRAEQRAQLCMDLLNLDVTVRTVVQPLPAMRVGELRAGLDKMVPTFEALDDFPVVPEAQREALLAAHSSYKAVIHGVSDDAPLREVRYRVGVPGGRLAAVYEDVVVSTLACARRPPPR